VTDGPIDPVVFANLVEMTGGEMEFVDELVDTFLADGERQIELMHSTAAGNDVTGLTRAAHSLKSGGLNVGALALGGLSRELEELGRSGTVPDVSGRIAAIESAFASARAALLDARTGRASG
jgi:HPt (histidine-containing phosphotransfer) domain-containing protein